MLLGEKIFFFTDTGDPVRVGNGGFSLRSKKVLNAFNDLKIKSSDDISKYNEDGIICVYFRKELEKMNITFAPVSVASKFSCEQRLSDSELETFGFHTYKEDFNSRFKNFIKILFNFIGIKIRRKINK
ncbi:hypothetical protein K9M50_03450 [Patescibacteria group bacterium]|nr:hypothetical protein [Patescibacteria group bacterium]